MLGTWLTGRAKSHIPGPFVNAIVTLIAQNLTTVLILLQLDSVGFEHFRSARPSGPGVSGAIAIANYTVLSQNQDAFNCGFAARNYGFSDFQTRESLSI